MDQQRIAQIAQMFLKENGAAALTEWMPSGLDRLEADLHATITSEYPGLDTNLRFRIAQFDRVRADGPWEVNLEISQVVGNIKLRVPR